MLSRFRQRQPGASLGRILWWHVCHLLNYTWFFFCYRFRFYDQHKIPATGPVLLVSNHQSMLDPIIVGMGSSHRQFYALARKTLWNNKLLGLVMDSMNGVPVDQDKPDASTMKRCIELLKQGHALLIFPEGARTYTGQTEDFEAGTMLIIRRAKPVVVPVALEGAFEAWPRTRKLPRLFGRIACRYGDPIAAETLLKMKPREALAHLRDTIEAMRVELSETLRR